MSRPQVRIQPCAKCGRPADTLQLVGSGMCASVDLAFRPVKEMGACVRARVACKGGRGRGGRGDR